MDMMRAFLKGFGDHLVPDERDPSAPPDPPAPSEGEPIEEEPPIKEAPIEMDGRVMNPVEFVRHVLSLEAPRPHPTRVFLHHTWRPTPETWQGRATMAAMKAYYEQQIWEDAEGRRHEGWNAGPHLFIAQDGIWLFSDLRYDGVGVYGHNYRSRHIEMVGNYDEQLPTGGESGLELGLQLQAGEGRALFVVGRWYHNSNADVAGREKNPGLDALGLSVGVVW